MVTIEGKNIMSIFYCTPTYKSFQECQESIDAVMNGSFVPDQVIIIDNSPDASGTSFLLPLTHRYTNVYIWPQGKNLGVAASWNLFHTQIEKDYIIIANDDIRVHTDTIKDLVTAAETTDKPLLVGSGMSGNAFSLFLLKQWAFHKIGPFDERFYPAYYEDNDYVYRAYLLGLGITVIDSATYDHVGSSTLRKYTQQEMEAHHNAFRGNQSYYLSKWGGLPTQEVYTVEFDDII
jgi:GT2 family glycosyltransferase